MYSLLLNFLVLSFSLHASHARHLGIISKDSTKDVEKIKFDETAGPAKAVQMVPENYQSRSHQAVTREVEASGSIGGASLEKPKKIERKRGTNSGVSLIQSLVTVSWRIPRDKHGEQLGFNLDYSPPKTHPPSHN